MDITYYSQVKISNQKLVASKRTKETNPKQGFYYEEMFECLNVCTKKCSNVLSFLLFSLHQKFKT